MVSTLKMAVIGAGAAGAAGLVAVSQPIFKSEVSGDKSSAVCFKADIDFFEGASARCYSQAEIVKLADAPLVDRDGAKTVVSLSHPTEMSAPPKEYSTCRGYREARLDGWYALTSADMRREAYFIRACGLLALLNEAQAAEHSYFDNGSPSEEEISALAGAMTFGEARFDPETVRVEKGQDHVWRVSGDALSVDLQEIANADFDNDGVEEILVFSAASPQGGTAAFYEVGLFEKDAPGAALAFTPLDFSADAAAGAAG
ncbi:MAG: hypothetical protein KAH44_27305 [Oricola sp.]|jgi:hypothetical protein|nr:hypothetical protein [Oricola sp.]